MTQKHSPGALRAAEAISKEIEKRWIEGDWPDPNYRLPANVVAAIIDREMNTEPRSAGASNLLAALELIAQLSNLNAALKDETTRDRNLQTIWATADAAIAKAKGESL